MSAKVVNIYVEPYDVYIGRGGRGLNGYFGNPFRLTSDTPAERERILNKYREWFVSRVERDGRFRRRIEELRDKTLGCFCKPKPCHGDVIVEFLAQLEEGQ